MFLALYVLLSLIAGIIGSDRAIGFWGFFLLSLITTPLATLAVLAVTNRRAGSA
jgi:hypothetical protein